MMQRAFATTLLGLTLATVTPALAQAPSQGGSGLQQTLQGLLSGNQNQDNAVRQAYERGYERGRDDEARRLRAGDRQYNGGSTYNRDGYSGGQGTYAPPGNNYYNR